MATAPVLDTSATESGEKLPWKVVQAPHEWYVTRPEIYVMGCRNPFRIAVDQRTGILYWGEVGPDAGGPNPLRGPAGFDEINQARKAGNFGWPMFAGDNRPYWNWDFATGKTNFLYDAEHPRNNSRYNTGPEILPPAQPALIWYPSGSSARFPVVNAGDGALTVAVCWSEAAVAMLAAGRTADAERRTRAALPVLEAGYGRDHALVANAYIGLGDARLTQGDAVAAARYFEEGRARMARSSIDDAYLASAEYGLAMALYRREPARAIALAEQAIARWRDDPGWTGELAEAEAWLREHRGRGR